MPVNNKLLHREKKKIILDIIFEDIIPNTNEKMFWSVDMLTAEVRRYNIDDKIRISRLDLKQVIKKLDKTNDKVKMHLINNDMFITFS